MRLDVRAELERQSGVLTGPAATRESFAHFVQSLGDWEWFATLTFDDERIAQAGVPGWTRPGWGFGDRATRQWLDGDNGHRRWARFREANDRGGWHFHALVAGVSGVSRRDAWQEWFDRHGLARVLPFDPKRGAGFYVSKYVVKDEGEIAWQIERQEETALALVERAPFECFLPRPAV